MEWGGGKSKGKGGVKVGGKRRRERRGRRVNPSKYQIGWWNIDCGSEAPHIGSNLIAWETDKSHTLGFNFTQAGKNKRLPQRQPLEEMNSLRFFPNRTAQNCYVLPVYQQTLRYLIRSGSTTKWSTVNTSLIGGPIYHETIYVTHGSSYIRVCLVQTRDGEVSTLPDFTSEPDNDPPYSVLHDSIQSLNASDPIILTVNLSQETPQTAYFVFYITKSTIQNNRDDIRTVEIYIDGHKTKTVTTKFSKCNVVTIYPINVLGPTINVTLAPTSNSTLPPLISAMEIFSRGDLDPAHETGSSCGTHEHLFSMYIMWIMLFVWLL
ncbi:hypothetical protein L1049_010982 [Liquidambar formosana]|uniref:Malectin-like domain-containing protein n=1 Tax=Liquidambar formosana TaxID=63359 RepID=A0AAP0WZF0_LIQFO